MKAGNKYISEQAFMHTIQTLVEEDKTKNIIDNGGTSEGITIGLQVAQVMYRAFQLSKVIMTRNRGGPNDNEVWRLAVSAVVAVSQGTVQEKLRLLFDIFDEDEDGLLNESELTASLEALTVRPPSPFGHQTSNNASKTAPIVFLQNVSSPQAINRKTEPAMSPNNVPIVSHLVPAPHVAVSIAETVPTSLASVLESVPMSSPQNPASTQIRIATLMALSPMDGAKELLSMSLGQQMETLCEMSPEERASTVAALDPNEAGASLNRMSTSDRNATLSAMSPFQRATILAHLSDETTLGVLECMKAEDRAETLDAMTAVQRAVALATLGTEVTVESLQRLSPIDKGSTMLAMMPENLVVALKKMTNYDVIQTLMTMKKGERAETLSLMAAEDSACVIQSLPHEDKITTVVSMAPEKRASAMACMPWGILLSILAVMSIEERAITLNSMSRAQEACALASMSEEERTRTLLEMDVESRALALSHMSMTASADALLRMDVPDRVETLAGMHAPQRAGVLVAMSSEERAAGLNRMTADSKAATISVMSTGDKEASDCEEDLEASMRGTEAQNGEAYSAALGIESLALQEDDVELPSSSLFESVAESKVLLAESGHDIIRESVDDIRLKLKADHEEVVKQHEIAMQNLSKKYEQSLEQTLQLIEMKKQQGDIIDSCCDALKVIPGGHARTKSALLNRISEQADAVTRLESGISKRDNYLRELDGVSRRQEEFGPFEHAYEAERQHQNGIMEGNSKLEQGTLNMGQLQTELTKARWHCQRLAEEMEGRELYHEGRYRELVAKGEELLHPRPEEHELRDPLRA